MPALARWNICQPCCTPSTACSPVPVSFIPRQQVHYKNLSSLRELDQNAFVTVFFSMTEDVPWPSSETDSTTYVLDWKEYDPDTDRHRFERFQDGRENSIEAWFVNDEANEKLILEEFIAQNDTYAIHLKTKVDDPDFMEYLPVEDRELAGCILSLGLGGFFAYRRWREEEVPSEMNIEIAGAANGTSGDCETGNGSWTAPLISATTVVDGYVYGAWYARFEDPVLHVAFQPSNVNIFQFPNRPQLVFIFTDFFQDLLGSPPPAAGTSGGTWPPDCEQSRNVDTPVTNSDFFCIDPVVVTPADACSSPHTFTLSEPA